MYYFYTTPRFQKYFITAMRYILWAFFVVNTQAKIYSFLQVRSFSVARSTVLQNLEISFLF